jgi:D-alanyl-D-alanine carboxypeptidase
MKRKISILTVLVIILVIGLVIFVRHASAPSIPSNIATHSATEHHSTPTQSQPFDKTAYSTTDPTSPWVVVNKQHPLNPRDYAPSDLTAVGNGQYMRAEAASALTTMLAAAKTAGYIVTPASGYRSYSTQVSVYNKEVTEYGQATADSESARPGFSEHQTGLAMDLASGNCSITDCFGDTPGGKWITQNAYKYGFLLRYPADKTDVTGYRAESWHFLYVGVNLATELHSQGIETLEEFFGITGGTTYVN